MKGNIKDFVRDSFNYREELMACSVERSVNRYLLEHIANGLVKYKGVAGFIKHADDWVRSLVKIYKEIGFDPKTNQVRAVIDLHDQLVVIDQRLYDDLEYVINTIDKYGLLITYNKKGSKEKVTTTLCKFFENAEGLYPVVKNRYKGLGSNPAKISKEMIMDPSTRRLIRVTMDDLDKAFTELGMLVGEGKDNTAGRKEMLMNFKFDKSMIDN